MLRRALFLLSVLTCLRLSVSVSAEPIQRTLAPGVVLTQEVVPPPAGPLLINILHVNLKAPGVSVQAQLARDAVITDDPGKGREPVGALAARHGAIAGVNADFFPFTGDPLGLTIHNGGLISEAMPQRVALGITADCQVRIGTLLAVGTLTASDGSVTGLDGINRSLNKDEIVLLTPDYGSRARLAANGTELALTNVSLPIRPGQDQTGLAGQVQAGEPNTPIPAGGAILAASGRGADWLRAHVNVGDTLRFRFDLVDNPLPAGPPRGNLASRAGSLRGRLTQSVWTDVKEAVGGGPWLVRDGKVAVDGVEEGFEQRDFVAARHPRTAVGVTASGELLLATVDGRSESSSGMTLPQMAALMLKAGAVNAINLDGGGSTTMIADGGYVNKPSDGDPRAIANALLVYANAPAPAETSAEPVTLHAGERVTLRGLEASEGGNAEIVWGTLEGTAWVDQNGVLTSTHAGNGTVVATAGAVRLRIPYTVLAGPPARLKATLAAAPNNPPDRNIVVVRVSDAYGNPISGQSVEIKAENGYMDASSTTTGSDGRAQVEVVWDAEANRRVVVRCANLSPVALKR